MGPLTWCMGPAPIRTSSLPLWLLCDFLSGLSAGSQRTQGTGRNHKDSEVSECGPKRVHDVIRGSGTAVSHCVIVYSAAHLYPTFSVLLGSCKVAAVVFVSSLVDFPLTHNTAQIQLMSVCSRKKQSEALWVMQLLSGSLIHTVFFCLFPLFWVKSQSDILSSLSLLKEAVQQWRTLFIKCLCPPYFIFSYVKLTTKWDNSINIHCSFIEDDLKHLKQLFKLSHPQFWLPVRLSPSSLFIVS